MFLLNKFKILSLSNIIDFDVPFTNNLSERNLRGIKSKMKVSGQFQNIDRAIDYANIRSYIETSMFSLEY